MASTRSSSTELKRGQEAGGESPSVAWLCAYAMVWSFVTAVSVYTLVAGVRHSHVEHLGIVLAFVVLCSASRALLGPRAARAAAWAFTPALFFFVAASIEAQDRILFGQGDWCGTGRLQSAFSSALLSLLMGILAVALFGLLRIRRQARGGGLGRDLLTPCLFACSIAFAAVGTVRAVERRTAEDLLASVVVVDEVPVGGATPHTVENARGDALRVSCPSKDATHAQRGCLVALDDDSASHAARSFSASVNGDETIRWRADPQGAFEVIEVVSPKGGVAIIEARVHGVPEYAIRVRDVPGTIGPSGTVLALGWLGIAVLGLQLWRGSRTRRGLARVLSGADAVLDAEGHVHVDGTQYLCDPALRAVLPAGPIVVLASDDRDGYREARVVTHAIAGRREELAQRAAADSADLCSVLRLAGALLVTPLVAAAIVGLI